MRPLTDSQARALSILAESGPIRPAAFAKAMWPDSPAWRRTAKCGPNGSHYGGGMYQAAGGFLGKLRRDGLSALGPPGMHVISREGERRLREHENRT